MGRPDRRATAPRCPVLTGGCAKNLAPMRTYHFDTGPQTFILRKRCARVAIQRSPVIIRETVFGENPIVATQGNQAMVVQPVNGGTHQRSVFDAIGSTAAKRKDMGGIR